MDAMPEVAQGVAEECDYAGEEECSEGTASPLVSVIIPVYNMAAFVSGAIRSVLEGELPEVEVIVADDGSTDNLAEVVARFTDPNSPDWDPRVRYFYQPNQGKSVATNQALGLARGGYVTILDADDRLPPDSLRLRYEAAMQDATAPLELVVGSFEVFDGDKVFGWRRLEAGLTRDKLIRRYLRAWRIPFHLNACLFSTELLQRVGGLDSRLRRCQDIDLALRALQAARRVTTISRVVYSYRKHRQSARDRIRYRLRTIYYRPMALAKNMRGWMKYPWIAMMIMADVAKLLYELRGNYTQ